MMKKIMLILVLATQARAMEINKAIGTILLTGSYYCAIEAYMQDYNGHISKAEREKYRNCYFAGAALLQASGLAMLGPILIHSNCPVTTASKFTLGAMSMAEGVYLLKMAKLHHDEFKKRGHWVHERERNQFLCGALLCGVFGSGMVIWAINDLK